MFAMTEALFTQIWPRPKICIASKVQVWIYEEIPWYLTPHLKGYVAESVTLFPPFNIMQSNETDETLENKINQSPCNISCLRLNTLNYLIKINRLERSTLQRGLSAFVYKWFPLYTWTLAWLFYSVQGQPCGWYENVKNRTRSKHSRPY